MKRWKNAITSCCVALMICLSLAACFGDDRPLEKEDAVSYYFDASAEEGGDGTEAKPYKSLSDIEKLELVGGEKICLKTGSTFLGGMDLKGISGTSEKPITVTSYGNVERDGLPKINGNNRIGDGILYIENCNFLTVENIEIYDSATAEGDRRGVLVNATNNDGDDVVTYAGIKLDGLYIHDVRGITDRENSGMSVQSKKTGGIHVWSEDGKGRFDGLTISNCRIDNVDNVGIATWRQPSTSSGKVSPYSSDFDKYSHSDVLISGNEISHIGKNAVFARNLKGGYIEHNIMYETATVCVSGNTICTSYVKGTIIQFNEGYYNRATARPSDGKLQDGCMLDADLQSRDTIWQYNYSHDNAFGLFLNCTSYVAGEVEDKATVRYNLSVNDSGNVGIVYINYASAGIDLYNNTFIVSSASPTILKSNANRKYSFRNNIIYNLTPSAKFAIADASTADISDNLVFNISGANIENFEAFAALNENGVYADPMFVKEYSASMDRNGRMFAENFKLKSGSPALGVGKEVASRPTDFFGNEYSRSIGFYCA